MMLERSKPASGVRRWILPVAAGYGALLLTSIRFEVSLCPIANLFHVPCPGCGLTRATLSLLRGDLERSLAMQPLVIPVLLALCLVAYWELREEPKTERMLLARQRSLTFAVVVAALLVALWLGRFAGYYGGPVPIGDGLLSSK